MSRLLVNNKTGSWDPTWETVFLKQEWGKYPGESLIQFIARNFYNKERSKINILEIGCGTGANLWYLAREGFNVTGIDGSKTAIEKSSKRLFEENLKARLFTGDIINLPFNDGEFDCIVDVECLSCNNKENSEKILSELARTLKNDGLFYSRTFTNEMYNGVSSFSDKNEITNAQSGPLAGKGLIRLTKKDEILELYGNHFNVRSVDKLEYTQFNGEQKISEFIIICSKA